MFNCFFYLFTAEINWLPSLCLFILSLRLLITLKKIEASPNVWGKAASPPPPRLWVQHRLLLPPLPLSACRSSSTILPSPPAARRWRFCFKCLILDVLWQYLEHLWTFAHNTPFVSCLKDSLLSPSKGDETTTVSEGPDVPPEAPEPASAENSSNSSPQLVESQALISNKYIITQTHEYDTGCDIDGLH